MRLSDKIHPNHAKMVHVAVKSAISHEHTNASHLPLLLLLSNASLAAVFSLYFSLCSFLLDLSCMYSSMLSISSYAAGGRER